jgi:hypothetical protein
MLVRFETARHGQSGQRKIVECEVVRDRLGMMIQLGAVPPK